MPNKKYIKDYTDIDSVEFSIIKSNIQLTAYAYSPLWAWHEGPPAKEVFESNKDLTLLLIKSADSEKTFVYHDATDTPEINYELNKLAENATKKGFKAMFLNQTDPHPEACNGDAKPEIIHEGNDTLDNCIDLFKETLADKNKMRKTKNCCRIC